MLEQQVFSGILNGCRHAKYYSVMIDERTDITNHEQVSLVIRYVNEKFNVYERFVGFERISSMTGEASFEGLVQWLCKLDLKLENMVDQCYDSASCM